MIHWVVLVFPVAFLLDGLGPRVSPGVMKLVIVVVVAGVVAVVLALGRYLHRIIELPWRGRFRAWADRIGPPSPMKMFAAGGEGI